MPDPVQPEHSEEPNSTRRRLAGLLREPTRRQLIVGLLLAVLGFAAVTQLRATERDETYAGYSEQALIDERR